MVQSKKDGPEGVETKSGKNNKVSAMKTGKNFVKGNKGPRPLMSLRPGPGPRGPPGFMRPGPYGPPPPGPPGPFYPPHPMMCPPGPPGFYGQHHGPPHMWGPMAPMPPPHFRGPVGPGGPHRPGSPMRRGPVPLVPPPQGMRRPSGPPGPRRGGPGPIRKPIGKPSAKGVQKKKAEPKIDFTDDTIDIHIPSTVFGVHVTISWEVNAAAMAL